LWIPRYVRRVSTAICRHDQTPLLCEDARAAVRQAPAVSK
jgi:hypothetical protein